MRGPGERRASINVTTNLIKCGHFNLSGHIKAGYVHQPRYLTSLHYVRPKSPATLEVSISGQTQIDTKERNVEVATSARCTGHL